MMTARVLFRPFRNEDIQHLSDLLRTTFNADTAPGWTDHALSRLHHDNLPEGLAKTLVASAYNEICVTDDEIAAVIICSKAHLISVIAVRETARHRHLGSALVEHFLDFADRQFPEIEILQVSATTLSAPFYSRLGFYPISETIDLDGCRFIRMAYWLRPRRLARKAM